MGPWNNFSEFWVHLESQAFKPDVLNDYRDDKWNSVSSIQMVVEIKNVALGLISLGLQKGECVAILASPSSRWTIANLAIILAGGIAVPIFANIADENFVYEINQTNVKILFVDHSEPNPLLDAHRGLFKTLINLYSDQNESELSYEALMMKGRGLIANAPNLFSNLLKQIRNEDVANIIYTSSTTGMPKGVELTNYNILRHLSDIPIPVGKETRYLSILPLAHIFGYALNLIILGWGGSIYYFNDLKNVGVACREIHPTLLVVVPRLLEKVYAKMLAAVQSAGFMKKQLGLWAFDLANQEEDSLLKYLVHPVVDKIVYSHLRESLGGSIEGIVSGGAHLNPHLNHFFHEIGIPILEGWGLTEACPVTVNFATENKIGTVGRPFKGFEIMINPDGEVLVRGSLVMKGYHKNPEATKEALDKDGWLHTGDKGKIDEEGFLTIYGRIKDLYKTSTGEWVAPVPIEQMLCKAPLIEHALAIGEGRKFVSCLLFPNKEVLESLKLLHDASAFADDEFLNSEFVRLEMDRLLEQVNKELNHWEQVRAYCFIPHSPSIELGEMTPSMKLRRHIIEKKYKHLIDAMYPEEAKV